MALESNYMTLVYGGWGDRGFLERLCLELVRVLNANASVCAEYKLIRSHHSSISILQFTGKR